MATDVSRINDEDVLRRMWQDTEDFGRKNEIRAHMRKLREAHADYLADHSFISMKSKDIRDSESPIRDVSYRIAGKGLAINQGWNVMTSKEKSDDGKTFTTSKVATTSGTDKITGGQIDYAAKNEQKASVYQDGDRDNFTKAVDASSNTFVKQEASGGDENSSFKTSSTKTSSSSKYVQEHRSTSGDVIESPTQIARQNQDNEMLVSRKVYTDNTPYKKTITIKTRQVDDSKDAKETQDVSSTKVCRRQDNETFINTEQDDAIIRMVPSTRKPEDNKQRSVSPEKHPKSRESYNYETRKPEDKKERPASPPPDERYDSPERRHPFKERESQWITETKPTDGQYDTTYGTDYTYKRITVDVSPTHAAFAKSLRAGTPDRISKCSSPSRGNWRDSTSSLRSSTYQS